MQITFKRYDTHRGLLNIATIYLKKPNPYLGEGAILIITTTSQSANLANLGTVPSLAWVTY